LEDVTVDLSPLMDAAVTLVSAIVAASAPVLLLKLSAMLKLNLDQSHRDAVAHALQTALGVGLQIAQETGDAKLANVNVRSAALAAMVGYVKQTVPEAVAHFGLTDDAIAQQAAAHLAATLHASPAATPLAPAAAPLPPQPVAAAPTPA
jgi:predicted metalloprotease with PDZ domain